jgi:hypothetical protein
MATPPDVDTAPSAAAGWVRDVSDARADRHEHCLVNRTSSARGDGVARYRTNRPGDNASASTPCEASTSGTSPALSNAAASIPAPGALWMPQPP